jgi:hypothetical protein
MFAEKKGIKFVNSHFNSVCGKSFYSVRMPTAVHWRDLRWTALLWRASHLEGWVGVDLQGAGYPEYRGTSVRGGGIGTDRQQIEWNSGNSLFGSLIE